MPDPLAQVIGLLRPRAVGAKVISGAGRWAVRFPAFGAPAFCVMTEGRCRLAVEGAAPAALEAGDFVLLPATPSFVMSSHDPAPGPAAMAGALQDLPVDYEPREGLTEIRYGRRDMPPDMRQYGGYVALDSPDAALLVSLLPRMIHVRGVPRLSELARLLGEEAARDAVGRSLILERLVEILFVEALRADPGEGAAPGLLRGLADPRVSVALRRIHGDPERAWTVVALAREAGMSRSAFFERFARTVGVRPMEYLVSWRMALAKDMLREGRLPIDDVARRTGYGSPGAFSTAFSRHVGAPPGRFMRSARAAAGARA